LRNGGGIAGTFNTVLSVIRRISLGHLCGLGFDLIF
jgi:hypothetical protein